MFTSLLTFLFWPSMKTPGSVVSAFAFSGSSFWRLWILSESVILRWIYVCGFHTRRLYSVSKRNHVQGASTHPPHLWHVLLFSHSPQSSASGAMIMSHSIDLAAWASPKEKFLDFAPLSKELVTIYLGNHIHITSLLRNSKIYHSIISATS